eukprot:1376524-Rhodomonas_salina.1
MHAAEEVSIDLTGEDDDLERAEPPQSFPNRGAVRSSSPIDLTDDAEVSFVDVESSSSGEDGQCPRKRARVHQAEPQSGGVPHSFGTSISSDRGQPSVETSQTSGPHLGCGWCKMQDPSSGIVHLACGHVVCKTCLLKAAECKCRCKICSRLLDVSDVQGILPAEKLTPFLDKLLYCMVDDDERFVRCPNEKCGNVIERAEEISRELPTHAPDGQPLSEQHAAHMQKNRYRCNACGENFCASCKVLPFHLAQTCEEAAASRAAVHCRFCAIQLPRGSKEGSACSAEECQQRKDEVCEVVHKRCRH